MDFVLLGNEIDENNEFFLVADGGERRNSLRSADLPFHVYDDVVFFSVRRSDRYRCLNNIPDYKSALFKDLNDEQKARELPGRFSDLNDQCRRAFGVNFEYCKDLSHGVKTSIERWTHSILVHFSRSALVSTVEKSTRISPRASPITPIGRTARSAQSHDRKSK